MLPPERFARVWMIALIVVFALYFGALQVLIAEQVDLTFLRRMGLLALALGSLGIIAAGTWAWLRLRRGEGEAPDERDRDIERRANQIGYYVLMAGFIYVGGMLPFTAKDKWEIVHAALFMIAVAEVVQSAVLIRLYRRGIRA